MPKISVRDAISPYSGAHGDGGAPEGTIIGGEPEHSRSYLAALLASCPDPIVGETPDGIINFWNPAAEKLYGYSAQEAIGQPVSILAPPGQEPEMSGLLRRVLQGEVVEAYESVRQAKNGRLLDVSLTIFPVRDRTGRIIGASATTRDVTQRRRDAAALAASERRFRAATVLRPGAVHARPGALAILHPVVAHPRQGRGWAGRVAPDWEVAACQSPSALPETHHSSGGAAPCAPRRGQES